MEPYQIARKYVNDVLKEMEKEGEYKYPAAFGSLSSDFSWIFITLSIRYPDAYKRILEDLKLNELTNTKQ